MATVQIPGLPPLTAIEDADLFIVREDSTSIDKKISASDLITYIQGSLDEVDFSTWATITSLNASDEILINQSGNKKTTVATAKTEFLDYSDRTTRATLLDTDYITTNASAVSYRTSLADLKSNIEASINPEAATIDFSGLASSLTIAQANELLFDASGTNKRITLDKFEESLSFFNGSGIENITNVAMSGFIDLGTNTIADATLTGNWGFSAGALSAISNITMTGTLDLGTNTIADGNFVGNWNFNASTLSGIATANLTTADFGANTIADQNMNGNWDFNNANLSGIDQLESAANLELRVPVSAVPTTIIDIGTDGNVLVGSGATTLTGGSGMKVFAGTGVTVLSVAGAAGENVLSFDASSNLGKVGTTTADALNIITNNTTRLAFDDSGGIDLSSGATLQSSDYQSGIKGWRIGGSAANAEFNNIRARGQIETVVFKFDETSATSGNHVFSNATVLTADVGTSDTVFSIEDAVFSIGDRLRLRKPGTTELVKVTGTGAGTITVTRDVDGDHVTDPTWNIDDPIVSMESRVEVTVNGTHTPYIDVITRTGDLTITEASKARLGNLAGIAGASGFGLWSENVFLTGEITATSGQIAGFEISGDILQSSAGNIVLDASTASAEVGTGNAIVKMQSGVGIWAGNAASGSAPFYVDTNGVLTATSGTFGGNLSAAGGTFSGSLSAATGSFAGSLTAATGTFAGDLSAAGGTFDGDLSAAGGTFTGNLSAAGGSFTGTLSAVGGSFTGTLSAATGSFSGTVTTSNITATGGEIGGFTITNTQIKSTDNNIILNADGSATLGEVSIDGAGNTTIGGTLSAATGTFAGSLTAATGTFAGDLSASGGTFDGSLSAATGTFAGNLTAAGGTFSGNLSAAGGTFAGDLSAAGGTFNGNLSAAGGTFSGTLSAATGSFSGTVTTSNITATGGTIGGFTLDSRGITSTGLTLYNKDAGASNSGYIKLYKSVFSPYVEIDYTGIDFRDAIGNITSLTPGNLSAINTMTITSYNIDLDGDVEVQSGYTLTSADDTTSGSLKSAPDSGDVPGSDNTIVENTPEYSIGFVNKIATVTLEMRDDSGTTNKNDSIVLAGYYHHAISSVSYVQDPGGASDIGVTCTLGTPTYSGGNTTITYASSVTNARAIVTITAFGRDNQ